MATRRGRRLRSGLLVGAAVVVAVGAAGGVAYARSGSGPAFRTAPVTRGPVTATLDLVGTVTPVGSAAVGFAQAGTVASVDVRPGDAVSAGQTLAQLDGTALQAELTQAQATEAAARQTLTLAEDGQLPAGSGSAGTRSASAVDTSGITAAQRAVESAQRAVDQSLSGSRAALAAAGTACGSGSTAAAPTPGAAGRTASSTPGTTGRTAAATPATASPAPASAAPADAGACLAAENALLDAENDLAAKQSALGTAQSALSRTLTQATASAGSPSGGGTPASAAQLAQYQAALDADTAAVTLAQQNLAQATAVSPTSGTVVAVGLSVGQTVAAASSSAVVTVASPGGYQVTATVPTADVDRVRAGEHASVVPDGGSAALDATVLSVAAASTGSGFPVVLGLTGGGAGLHQGASAAVTLTTGSVAGGLVVPTSAVRTVGTRHVVEVLDGATAVPTAVTVGIVGPLRTQVLSGLKAGQRVVLADLTSTVTSDSSTAGSRGGLAGFGGGLGGTRFAGGGAGFARPGR